MHYPTKQMTDAYIILTTTKKTEVTFGKEKEHKLLYEKEKKDIHHIKYIHYGVLVADVTYKSTDSGLPSDYIIEVTSKAFSNTDRDNTNGLIKLMLPSKFIAKAHRQDETLYLIVPGCKIKTQKIWYNVKDNDYHTCKSAILN